MSYHLVLSGPLNHTLDRKCSSVLGKINNYFWISPLKLSWFVKSNTPTDWATSTAALVRSWTNISSVNEHFDRLAWWQAAPPDQSWWQRRVCLVMAQFLTNTIPLTGPSPCWWTVPTDLVTCCCYTCTSSWHKHPSRCRACRAISLALHATCKRLSCHFK